MSFSRTSVRDFLFCIMRYFMANNKDVYRVHDIQKDTRFF